MNKKMTLKRAIAQSKLKTLSKQRGGVSKLMLIMIVAGLGFGGYMAHKKGVLSVSKVTSIVKSVTGKSSSNKKFSGYGVQLMATQKLDQAKALMNDFARDGYSAFVVASSNKGRTYYKVRLGPYSHRPEAVAIQDKVARRYPHNPYVKSSLVIYKPN